MSETSMATGEAERQQREAVERALARSLCILADISLDFLAVGRVRDAAKVLGYARGVLDELAGGGQEERRDLGDDQKGEST